MMLFSGGWLLDDVRLEILDHRLCIKRLWFICWFGVFVYGYEGDCCIVCDFAGRVVIVG
jgi:hypothetical protein